MALAAGTKLGPYEILLPLGAGGMGEVYKARDTRLDRTVAVKILPTHLSSDPEAKQRFDREARSISSLSHPNICPLFDVGHQDGTDYLVMEFLEGETLAARITRGPLPTDQLLKIGVELSDGLDRAHKTGVVHRDLKPANVMLTKSGAKLMDFGLAKATEEAVTPASSLTQTLNSPGSATPLTQAGMVVGTFQYMSPEQVEGKPADTRSDIFSLGALLYEMASGKRPFDGRTTASVIAAILERDPAPISTIQPTSPASLDRLVKSCLAKDPDDRWQTAHDVKLQLQNLRDSVSQSAYSGTGEALAVQAGTAAAQAARTRRNRDTALLVLGTMLVSALVFSALGYVAHAPRPETVLQAAINLPPGAAFDKFDLSIALSPDGSKLAFVARDSNGEQSLWVRPLDSPNARSLPGAAGGEMPFWSPDSRSIGFFADGKLKRVDVATGNAATICEAPSARGGSWGNQGTIAFAAHNTGPLSVVPATGGTPVTATDVGDDAGSDRLPWFLPDGVHALFVRSKAVAFAKNSIGLVDTKTREVKILFESDSQPEYAEPGYVLFLQAGSLVAQPFDAKKLATAGDPFPVVQEVTLYKARRSAQFSVANNGTLVYVHDTGTVMQQLAWYDLESGRELAKIGEPARFTSYALSPDDDRVVASIASTSNSAVDSSAALWMYEVKQNSSSRFTFGEGSFRLPIWSTDGRSVFYEQISDAFALYRKAASGGADPVAIPLPGASNFAADAVSPDGAWLAVSGQRPRFFQVDMVPLVPGRTSYTFVSEKANVRGLTFSPDGKWASYLSDETGKYQLYVVPFPGPGGRWQISKDGAPRGGWTKIPNRLMYMGTDDKFYVADVAEKNGEIEVRSAHVVFGGEKLLSADSTLRASLGVVQSTLARDVKRILLAAPAAGGSQAALQLITNWPLAAKNR